MDFTNFKLPKKEKKKKKNTKESKISRQHRNCKRMKIIDNRGEKRIRRRSYPKNMSYKLNEKKKNVDNDKIVM